MILSRTYQFLNLTYDQFYNLSEKEISHVSDDDDIEINFEEENNLPIGNVNMDADDEVPEDSDEEQNQPVNNIKMPMALRKLQTFYNPNPFQYMQRNEEIAENALLMKLFGQEEIIL